MIEQLDPSHEWPEISDVQYQKAYVLASAHIDGGDAICLVDRELGIAHPVISRPIEVSGRTASDHITPYGYAGPASIGTASICPDPTAASEFDERLGAWARANHVICEFRRQHPAAAQASPLDEHDRDLIAIDLSDGHDAAFALAAGRHRTAVRKAQRSGVTARQVPSASLAHSDSPFRIIYAEAMERLRSAERYRVDDAYFESLLGLAADDIVLIEAVLDDEVVAAAIFLTHPGGQHAFYHLSASTEVGNRAAATNLVIDAGSAIATERGAQRLVLGGGLSSGDNLEKFKSSVGSLRLPFIVRRTVYSDELFSAAVAQHRPALVGKQCDYFPAYRSTLTSS